MNKIKNLPDLIPSLLLDYDRTDRFSPSINFKRNVVQFQDRINSVTIAGIDTPQYRLGPLGAGPRGILVQGAYTNLIPNNVTFGSNIFAIEGSFANHIATNVSNIGPRGLSALTMITQAAASAQSHSRGLFFVYGSMGGLSKTYAFSAYVKQAGTKPTNATIRIGYYPDGTGDNYAVNLYCDFKTLVDERNYRAFPVGDGWWRLEVVGTVPANNTSTFAGIWLATQENNILIGEEGYGLSIASPQLELSDIASSSLITNGSQVTTPAETFVMDVSNYIGNGEFSYAAVTYSDMLATTIRFCDGATTYNDWLGMIITPTLGVSGMRDGSVDKYLTTAVTGTNMPFARNISICSYSNDKSKVSAMFNGTHLPSSNIAANINPSNKKTLRIGVNGQLTSGKSVVEKLIIWPKTLSQAEMLAIHKALL